MNKKSKELGLKDSHFCTPSGLEIEGKESQCYSSAYDIARRAA
jgi:D-alanyl-D-alanine carboxypeptidase